MSIHGKMDACHREYPVMLPRDMSTILHHCSGQSGIKLSRGIPRMEDDCGHVISWIDGR